MNIYLYEYLKKCDHIPILDFNKFIKDTNNCLDLTVDFYLNIKINKSDNVYRWINYLFYDTDEINYLCNHINKNNDIKIFFKKCLRDKNKFLRCCCKAETFDCIFKTTSQ